MGDKPQAPQLPKDVPPEISDFFECKSATVTLKDGALGWITLPDELKSAMKEGAKPKLTIAPGETPGSATITVSLPTKLGIDASFSLPATITNGQFNVDTSESYLPESFKEGINQSVKELNDWFKANGKGFGPPAFGKGQVALSKVDLAPAPAQTTTVPTPVPGPDMPKPTEPPVDSGPPVPQAAGTDWLHLTPTREQWDKALEEAKAAVPPPTVGPPLVGAGGPGGPKAPVGLGGVAWNYIVIGIVVALVGAAGIYFVGGPALGLFGAAGPTPSGTPAAVVSPSPSPSPSPSATPAPRIVASDDGLVTLTIPNGSAPVDAPITVTALGQADAPPELEGVTFRGPFYRLAPVDLALTGPVTIDRRIDLVGIDPQRVGYPVVTLALRTPDAKWTWLAEQHLSFVAHAEGAPIEYELHATATLTSLGDVFGLSGGVRKNYRLEPAESTFTIGQSFTAFVTLDAAQGTNLPADQQPRFTSVLPFASQDGIVQFGTPSTTTSSPGVEVIAVPVTCEQDATVTVGANGTLSHAVLPSDLLTKLALGTDVDVSFVTGKDIRCATGSGAGPTLTGGCVSVVHQPLGSYPSHLHWVVTFTGDVPSSATLTITYREGSTGILEFEDIPIVRGTATADTGITSYGTKTIVGVTVHAFGTVFDVTDSALKIFGSSVTVTSEEENLGGNACQ